MTRSRTVLVLMVAAALAAGRGPGATAAPIHNLILFVPDGLRALKADVATAPAMAALRDRGVNFTNPHALLPTFTMANASAMATGHFLGDSGTYSNAIFSGVSITSAAGTVTPFLESDVVIGEMDQHFHGNYLNEVTVMRAAREAGLSTAAVGKIGPALVFDHENRTGTPTIVFDDATGTPDGIPLSDEMRTRLEAAGLPAQTPSRGDNGKSGTATAPGTVVVNQAQQDYFIDVTTRVLLPMFKARQRPFMLVFWSRDPDGTQHNHGDSLNQLVPGVNGPTSTASIRNADGNLARIEKALADLGLSATTNVVVSADHGVSTISKESQTSAAAKTTSTDVPSGLLPPGFLALDLAKALGLPLFDPENKNEAVVAPLFPKRGNGLIGRNPQRPDVVVAANGGSDLIYLPTRDRALLRRVIDVLLAQDYVSGLFVDSTLGSYPGTLPMSAINLEGKAATPRPTIVVGFRSTGSGCPVPVLCAVEVADSTLQQGQGMHGSFSRADSMNFMAAAGPDFKRGFVDLAPSGNADVGQTLAHLLGLTLKPRGGLTGRVLTEALIGGRAVSFTTEVRCSDRSSGGLQTVLRSQHVGRVLYIDAAGFEGRTVGLGAPGTDCGQ